MSVSKACAIEPSSKPSKSAGSCESRRGGGGGRSELLRGGGTDGARALARAAAADPGGGAPLARRAADGADVTDGVGPCAGGAALSGRTAAIRVESIRTAAISVEPSVASEYRPGDAGLAGASGSAVAPEALRGVELILHEHNSGRRIVSRRARCDTHHPNTYIVARSTADARADLGYARGVPVRLRSA
jgi:hypothetical protein